MVQGVFGLSADQFLGAGNSEAFVSIRDVWVNYIQNFSGKNLPLKEISDFRFLIVENLEELFPEKE